MSTSYRGLADNIVKDGALKKAKDDRGMAARYRIVPSCPREAREAGGQHEGRDSLGNSDVTIPQAR